MKKILVALLVLALGMPLMAEVAVTAADLTGGHLRITVSPTNGAVVRGVALVLERTGDATVASTAAVTATGLNTFIDYALSVGASYTAVGQGHPAAKWNTPGGQAVFPGDSAKFSLCAGYLDEDGDGTKGEGVAVDSFFDVFYTGTSATIAISLDTIRGGIVGDTLGAVTVQASQTLGFVVNYTLAMSAGANGTVTNNSGSYASGTVVDLIATPNQYYKFVNWTGDVANVANVNANPTTITMNAPATIVANFVKKTCFEMLSAADQLEYNKYIAAGKTSADMVSWCWRFQCRGDGDNAAYLPTSVKWQVYQADMNIMIAQWKRTYATSTNVAADFDHMSYLPTSVKWTVYQGDMNIMIANWKKTATTLIECPSYLP